MRKNSLIAIVIIIVSVLTLGGCAGESETSSPAALDFTSQRVQVMSGGDKVLSITSSGVTVTVPERFTVDDRGGYYDIESPEKNYTISFNGNKIKADEVEEQRRYKMKNIADTENEENNSEMRTYSGKQAYCTFMPSEYSMHIVWIELPEEGQEGTGSSVIVQIINNKRSSGVTIEDILTEPGVMDILNSLKFPE